MVGHTRSLVNREVTMLTVHLLVLAAVVILSAAEPRYYELSEAAVYFGEFMVKYDKKYPTEEEKARRYEIFKENLKEANRLNSETTITTYGITKFSDLTKQEFLNMYTGLVPKADNPVWIPCPNSVGSGARLRAPENFDWRDQGKVSPVKDQGNCGSCWTFSTTGNIESQYAIKYDQMVLLSEQQIVDCDLTSSMCNGGFMSNAMLNVMEKGGIESEDDYPYEAKNGTCHFDASRVRVKVSTCRSLNIHDDEELKEELYNTGPLAIALDATMLQIYNGGIIKSCTSDGINHAVLLVGYGNEGSIPYWIIKNSWGDVGERGYFRIKRGGNCMGLINELITSAVVG